MEETSSATVFESVVLNVPECFVYKVPPLKTASGHRAEEWGLDTPLFTDETTHRSTDDNLSLFCECVVEVTEEDDMTSFVDGVIDSSRYYVLRIRDVKSGRSAFIGIGFRERDTAFDFKSALNEYIRYMDRQRAAQKMAEQAHEEVSENPSSFVGGDSGQYALKEGTRIHISVPHRSNNTKPHNHHGASSNSGGSVLLPPPPTAGSIVGHREAQEDDEWGDFASA